MDSTGPSVTKAEIQNLSRWARVALAARCARRVQPLFAKIWKDANQAHLALVEEAVSVAEKSAAEGETPANINDIVDRIAEMEADLRYRLHANEPACCSFHGAYCAAKSAQERDNASSALDAANCCDKIGDCCPGPKYPSMLRRSIRQDVVSLPKRNSGNDNEPVPAKALGDLWHKGQEPDWYKIAEGIAKWLAKPK